MANAPSRTEKQLLEDERDAILACLAVCEAARASTDQAFERITEERQKSTSKDDSRVVSSLSELIRASCRPPSRRPQPETLHDNRSEADRDIAGPSQPTNLAHRQRENQPHTERLGVKGGRKEGCGNSAAGSQEDLREESFVMVENLDEGEPDGGF